MGVRKDGITLVDDVGGGSGTPVDATIVAPLPLPVEIDGPLGANVVADSVSVTIATNQPAIPVDIGAPVTIVDPILVDQNEPNADLAKAWPIKVTDGVDTAAVVSVNDGLVTTTKGLVSQAILYIKNNDGTVTEWNGGTTPSQVAQYPAVRALRTIRNDGPITLDAVTALVTILVQTYHVEAGCFLLRDFGFQGTIQARAIVNGISFDIPRIYDVLNNQWISGTIINPGTDLVLTYPIAGFESLSLVVIAYTSGSMLGYSSAGPGNNFTYSEVTATDLDIRDLVSATDKVGARLEDAVGNPIVSTDFIGIGRGINIHTGLFASTVEELTAPVFPIAGLHSPGGGFNSYQLIAAVNTVPSSAMMGLAVRQVGLASVSTKTDLTPSAPTVASVGVASAQAVAAAATRKGLILRNLSNARISLGFGAAAVLDNGVTLYPRDTFEMDEYDFDLGAVNAIASAAASSLAVQEYLT